MGPQRAPPGGHLVLILGRRRQPYTATEVPVADSVPILRAYLRRWKFEVGMFFDGMSPDSTDAEWRRSPPSTRSSSPLSFTTCVAHGLGSGTS